MAFNPAGFFLWKMTALKRIKMSEKPYPPSNCLGGVYYQTTFLGLKTWLPSLLLRWIHVINQQTEETLQEKYYHLDYYVIMHQPSPCRHLRMTDYVYTKTCIKGFYFYHKIIISQRFWFWSRYRFKFGSQ